MIVSVLFHDDRSTDAMTIANMPATHVMSSLAWAETHAVIARIERERALANALVDAARETLSRGPWRRLMLDPDGTIVARLTRAWPLLSRDSGTYVLIIRYEVEHCGLRRRFHLAGVARGVL